MYMVSRPDTRFTMAVIWVFGGTWFLPCVSCSRSDEAQAPREPPNVVWIVWDTVRSDHLSLYGFSKPTTPYLDEWSKGARVFDDCRSAAGYTLPSHASMFTGLLPSEHGTHNGHQHLDDCHITIAELLQEHGYQTYAYSANPHICAKKNLTQGFDTEQHPFDDDLEEQALAILKAKITDDDVSNELPAKIRTGRVRPHWDLKASGALAQRCVESWLQRRDTNKPYFVFLNYMEAHRPLVPPKSYRKRMMSEARVEASYKVDRSFLSMWEYIFRLREYTEEDLAVIAGTYDAALAELDDLLRNLLTSLTAKGHLDNTIIILTADHGEHLGEQHMLDHQYSLYEPLLRVPLVVHYPPRFKSGRDLRPVMNFDIFPTLLELAGIEPPPGMNLKAISLLSPREKRSRYSEEPCASTIGSRNVQRSHPDFDPSPWERRLRAVVTGPTKFIWGSDGRHELYDLDLDPGEQNNLKQPQSERLTALTRQTDAFFAKLRTRCEGSDKIKPLTEKERRLFRSLGYVGGGEEEEEDKEKDSSTDDD